MANEHIRAEATHFLRAKINNTPETADAGNAAHAPDFPAENATEEVRRG